MALQRSLSLGLCDKTFACMQSIADLGMGERFRDLARQITLNVHGALSGKLCVPLWTAMRNHVLGH